MSKTKLISLDDLSLEELEVDAELIPLMTWNEKVSRMPKHAGMGFYSMKMVQKLPFGKLMPIK